MTAEAQSLSPSGRAHPPRKLRNFLLEPKFQLKYTGMVVGVTLVVAAVLGFQAYEYSTGQTQLRTVVGSALPQFGQPRPTRTWKGPEPSRLRNQT